jgi:hypothetical protein
LDPARLSQTHIAPTSHAVWPEISLDDRAPRLVHPVTRSATRSRMTESSLFFLYLTPLRPKNNAAGR